MAFDTAAYLSVIQPPVFTHEGREWRGRFLSIDQWLGYTPRMDALTRGLMTVDEAREFYRELCDEMFPPTIRQRLTRSVLSSVLLRLPPAIQEAAMRDFCDSQLAALGLTQTSNRETPTRPKMTEATK